MKINCSYCDASHDAGETCPKCGTLEDSRDEIPRFNLSQTMAEMGSLAPRTATRPEEAFPVPPQAVDAADHADTRRFRPSRRPPTPLLKVLDDDGSVGEVIRLRSEHFVIGREEGDLKLAHDGLISGVHARLSRGWELGRCFWELTDLESANGVFIRVDGEQVVEAGQHFQVGQRVFRLEAANSPVFDRPEVTQRYCGVTPANSGGAQLTEVNPTTTAVNQVLDGDQFVLGRGLDCDVVLLEDDLVSPRHAELRRNEDGAWSVIDLDSLNGVWIAVPSVKLFRPTEFQLGEQRFIWDLV